MRVGFKAFLSLTISLASVVSFGAVANAQQVIRQMSIGPIPDAYVEAFYKNSWTLFQSRQVGGQLRFMLGPSVFSVLGTYPENQVARDAELITMLNRDILLQQLTDAPIVRVPDLPNPFDASLMTLPSIQRGGRVMGSEFIYEKAPIR